MLENQREKGISHKHTHAYPFLSSPFLSNTMQFTLSILPSSVDEAVVFSTTLLGFLLYWLPLIVCTVGYIARTYNNYQKDLKARAAWVEHPTEKYYTPTDTVGTLIGRGIVSIIPVANLIAAVFDVAPRLLGNFFKMLGDIFDQPLVPKLK